MDSFYALTKQMDQSTLHFSIKLAQLLYFLMILLHFFGHVFPWLWLKYKSHIRRYFAQGLINMFHKWPRLFGDCFKLLIATYWMGGVCHVKQKKNNYFFVCIKTQKTHENYHTKLTSVISHDIVYFHDKDLKHWQNREWILCEEMICFLWFILGLWCACLIR